MGWDLDAVIDRRDALKLGLLAGAGLAFPLAQGDDEELGHGHPAHAQELLASPAYAPFRLPLRIPPVLRPVRRDATTDYYDVTMKPGRVIAVPGKRTAIWGYNGQFPGPTIRARRGRRVVVQQVNRLPVHTAVHLHGGHVAAVHDGGTTELIAPNKARTYAYPNAQPTATLWYHDHAMHHTATNVYRGLAGFYLIGDPAEAKLRLPGGAFDVPLMLQDRAFNRDGSLNYPTGNRDGFVGDVLLVNGVAQPYFRVHNRKYRLRILNASNSREYELQLSSGRWLAQIATDGGLLPKPLGRPSIRLAPGERVEVVIDFGRYPVGSRIVLKNRLGRGRTTDIMRFDVVRGDADTSALPAALRPLPALPAARVTRTFSLDYLGQYRTWAINGRAFDPARVDARPKLGTAEIWRFTNPSPTAHPMHLHMVMFRILDRNGRRPPAWEQGWKDTVMVRPRETVRVVARFAGFTGRYVFHCHNLEHEDYAMMAQFQVVR